MESHDNIQKAKFFPKRLLESLRKASPPYICDLHGYSCKDAADLMQNAFSSDLPHKVTYSFILGAGRHSTKKFRVELSKACRKGLSAAGLTEDRHASEGDMGKFKCIEDNDHDLCMVKVFPKSKSPAEVGPTYETECLMTSEEGSATQNSLAAAIECVRIQCELPKLQQLSILGLVGVLCELLRLLQEGFDGHRRLKLGLDLSMSTQEAVNSLHMLQAAWKLAFRQWRSTLFASGALSLPESSACSSLLNEIEKSRLPNAKSVGDLRAALEIMPLEKQEEFEIVAPTSNDVRLGQASRDETFLPSYRQRSPQSKTIFPLRQKASANQTHERPSKWSMTPTTPIKGSLQSHQRLEPLQEILAGMCEEGPLALEQVEKNYFEWTGEKLERAAESLGHTLFSLLRSVPGCEVVQGDSLRHWYFLRVEKETQQCDSCVPFSLTFQPSSSSDAGGRHVGRGQEESLCDTVGCIRHGFATEIFDETISATAKSLKVVSYAWDASGYDESYMSLAVGEEILDAGFLDVGWAFGEVRNTNGTVVRRGWYPPEFVRSKDVNADASTHDARNVQAGTRHRLTHQEGMTKAATSDDNLAACYLSEPLATEVVGRERPWRIVQSRRRGARGP